MPAFLLPSRPPVPAHSRRRRADRTLAALVPAVLLALAALLSAGGAAAAHDELTGSTPAEGAVVDVLPPGLELSFSSVPSGIGAQIQVLDGSGEDWADGPAEIIDRSATQPLRPGAPAGEYTVNWRVVSSDSHPIEGSFAFTTQEDGATTPDTAGTAGPLDVQDDQADETRQAGVSDFPWSVVFMIAALVAITVVLAVTARRRLGADR